MAIATRHPGAHHPRRRTLPPDAPVEPDPAAQRGNAGTGSISLPGFVLLAVIIVIPLVWNVYLTFTE